MKNEKYYQLLLHLLSKNKERAKELYYLVLGFLGSSE